MAVADPQRLLHAGQRDVFFDDAQLEISGKKFEGVALLIDNAGDDEKAADASPFAIVEIGIGVSKLTGSAIEDGSDRTSADRARSRRR